MKFIRIAQAGGPEALEVAEGAEPVVGEHDVLIKIAAAGLNRADLLQRRGRYQPPTGVSSILGLEVSGHVVAVGKGVAELGAGDAVCALLEGGGYAEYCIAKAGQVLPIPRGLDMVQAASLPEAYFTVWSNVFEFGRLRGGETLLVHGGASGIGVAAIQLARALGHRVFATAGAADKALLCEQLGAERAINYRESDFVEAINALTNGRGVDVVLDMVGGPYVARNLQALATDGRLVIIASQGGVKGEVDVLRIMQRRLVITGSLLRPRDAVFKAHIARKVRDHVWPLLEAGVIRPIVDQVFAFEDAAQAHAYMERGAHKGKIILRMNS